MSLSRKLLVYKYIDNPHLGQSNKRNIGHVSKLVVVNNRI